MKINKLFHWLYAFLMGLPLLSSLWIGLIWTFNENAQVPTITENVSKEVDFNQVVNNGYLVSNGLIYDDLLYYKSSSTSTFGFIEFPIKPNTNYRFSCYITIELNAQNYICAIRELDSDGNGLNYRYITINQSYDNRYIVNFTSTSDTSGLRLQMSSTGVVENIETSFYKTSMYDLDQMGITNNEFETFFTDDYYDYTLSKHIVIENYTTRQTLDSPVNYIWLPSFGGIGWTIQNVFNTMVNGMFGLATTYGIGLTIVKLLSYWLCISLIWLIYDVIMYVPLMIHRWLDKGVIS